MAGPERLVDFFESHRILRVSCQACGHHRLFQREAALATFGERATALSIEKQMKCSRCGSRRCAAGR